MKNAELIQLRSRKIEKARSTWELGLLDCRGQFIPSLGRDSLFAEERDRGGASIKQKGPSIFQAIEAITVCGHGIFMDGLLIYVDQSLPSYPRRLEKEETLTVIFPDRIALSLDP